MGTVETVLLVLLVSDAIALTVLVLLQQGKGADVGAAFGSGSANTMFGAGGSAPFMTKLTAWLAIGFFVITFGLAYIAKERAASAGSLGIPTIENTTTDSDVPVVDQLPEGDVPALAPGGEDTPPSDVPDL
ncbi:MAG: preprotein translocase subunit SecG [Pseudomonadota bacterium]